MGFSNGQIILYTRNGLHFTGNKLFGKLIFEQQREISFRGIYVKLKGYCHVHWTEGQGRRSRRTYESREQYVDQKNYLIRSVQGTQTISPGRYEYEFSFVIPSKCPSSYEGEHGHVRYHVKAVMDRTFKFNKEIMKPITVVAPLDLNYVPAARMPIMIVLDEVYYSCCWLVGAVIVSAKLAQSGFVPEQTIPIEFSARNTGSVSVTVHLKLKKDITFHGSSVLFKHEKRLSQVLGHKHIEVPASTTRSCEIDMQVSSRDMINMRDCHCIDVDYRIKMILSPEGCHKDSMVSKNILIGSIPLVSKYRQSGQNEVVHVPPNRPVVTQPHSATYPKGNFGKENGGKETLPHFNANQPYPNHYPNNSTYPRSMVGSNTSIDPNLSANVSFQYPPPYTPTLGTGTVDFITQPSPNSYATASAPEPESSPDNEQKKQKSSD